MLMSEAHAAVDRACVQAIRTLSIDAIERANSGHPGLPLGAAPMAYVLWQRFLTHDPADPAWPDRDRFILSAGHGSMLIYSLLHLTGYDLPLDEIKSFRQWQSRTPGHPEFGHVPGVEATTGPLGQGSANAVGMAMAERFLAGRYNKPGHNVVDHWTWALVSDGDLMEGISAEAASLAGHLGLGKLVYLYDANDVSLDGPNSLCFSTEDVAARYRAYGWHVQTVTNGDEGLGDIEIALEAARSETAKPSLVIVKTTIGYGSPNKSGNCSSHGAPLGTEEVRLTKQALGADPEAEFAVSDEVRKHFADGVKRGSEARNAWKQRFAAWRDQEPELAAEWDALAGGELPAGWDAAMPQFEGGAMATRDAGGKVLNAIASKLAPFFGGDADLGCSTKTTLVDQGSFNGQSGLGRNVHFGVREHAMGAIANGIAYHGGLRTFTGTFFVFSDYMRPAMRLAAMNELPVTFVFTHDSIAVGEDGPTHQPIEHLASLRAMPGLVVIRPADANETAEAWRWSMEQSKRPVTLVLSRQKLTTIDRKQCASAKGLARGAYVLCDPAEGAPRAILIATGSEVELALAAKDALQSQGIGVRVVSMPSWELFEEQDASYRAEVLPPSCSARVSIEAGATQGWRQYVGEAGVSIGIDHYGASAPGDVLYTKFGFTAERIVQSVRDLLSRAVIEH